MRKICIALALIIAPVLLLGQEVEIAAYITFLEGPTADRDGNVYFVDRSSERIMMLSPDGALSTYRSPNNTTNGLVNRQPESPDRVRRGSLDTRLDRGQGHAAHYADEP